MRDVEFSLHDETGWHTVYALKDCLESIQYRATHQDEIITALQEENEKLKNGAWANETLQKLKEERDRTKANAQRGFGITEEESAAIKEWQERHIKEQHGGNTYHGAIGGNWCYEFVPTSIGTIGTCICSECAAKVEQHMIPYMKESLSFRRDKKHQFVEFYDSEFVFEDI